MGVDLAGLDFRDFLYILLTIFIAMFFVVFWTWRVDLQDCIEDCTACIEMREFLKKVDVYTPESPSRPGYLASIGVTIDINDDIAGVMSCATRRRFNISEFMDCSRIVHPG